VSGTVGGGRMGWFHSKSSFKTFVEHLVCQIKFSNEGKFLNFQSVGNVRKGERKRFNKKESKKKGGKMNKIGDLVRRVQEVEEGALGCWGEKWGNEGARVF
jgi:hypothetical protein